MNMHTGSGYIPRKLEKFIKQTFPQFPSLAITGPRQSGKSTMLTKIFPKLAYVTMDDPLVREQASADPNLFLERIGEPVIIDEIQYIPQIYPYLKMQIDMNRSARGRYLLTGSQQHVLLKGLGESLAGRIAITELLPFSIPEILPESSNSHEIFAHCALKGLFPEPNTIKNIDPSIWYGSYIQTYLERDIRLIHNIGDIRDFQRLLQLLAARCSTVLNMSSLATELGVAVSTVKRWISVLESSRIIYLLPPYYENLGKRLTKAPKVYFLDTGLVCHLTRIREIDFLINGPMAGPLFENLCVQETVKSFLNRGMQPPLYYFRSQDRLEVDLLIEIGAGSLVVAEFKLTKTPRFKHAAALEKFRLIARKDIFKQGYVVCTTDIKLPLASDISIVSLQEYLKILVTLT